MKGGWVAKRTTKEVLAAGQHLFHGVDCDRRSKLAADMPTHAVADNKEVQLIVDEVVVLIVGSLDANVSHATGCDAHRSESIFRVFREAHEHGCVCTRVREVGGLLPVCGVNVQHSDSL